MKVIGTSEFDQVIASEKPVLVDFFADWCGPCKMLAPILEQAAAECEGKADIVKVNEDESGELAARYGVQSIPTLIVFQNGEIKQQAVGFMSKEQVLALLD